MPYSAISWTVLAKQRIFPWTSVNQVKKTKRQQEFNKLRGKVITLKEQNKTKEQNYVAELK
jgi:activator of HSP90 ATPase